MIPRRVPRAARPQRVLVVGFMCFVFVAGCANYEELTGKVAPQADSDAVAAAPDDPTLPVPPTESVQRAVDEFCVELDQGVYDLQVGVFRLRNEQNPDALVAGASALDRQAAVLFDGLVTVAPRDVRTDVTLLALSFEQLAARGRNGVEGEASHDLGYNIQHAASRLQEYTLAQCSAENVPILGSVIGAGSASEPVQG